MNHKQVPGAQDKRALLALGQEARRRIVLGKKTSKPSFRATNEQEAIVFPILVLFPSVQLIFSIITMPCPISLGTSYFPI